MRHLITFILLTTTLFGDWQKGFNFRATSGYVKDGANETYVIYGDNYPTTRNGVTFGWTHPYVQTRDRNSGLDRRLAGTHYWTDETWPIDFRIDLPATGSFEIRLAFGDASSDWPSTVQIKDTDTVLFTVSGSTVAAHFLDATGVDRTAAAWPGSNASVTQSFASQIFKAQANQNNGAFAHIFIKQAGGRRRNAVVSQNLSPRFLAELLLSRSIR